MELTKTEGTAIGSAVPLEPAGPLWKRVPPRDESGRAFSDFMMIIPGLRAKPAHIAGRIVNDIRAILSFYKHVVVFAELNLRLNVLWVTVKPVPGICVELPAAIHMRVPEAKLVAHKV